MQGNKKGKAKKYLGEMINNKGNLSDHIAKIVMKIKGATIRIIAEAGNKEFKGIKLKAIWQLVDSKIIPMLAYACESWIHIKDEKAKIQTILKGVIESILYLPKGIPTTIILCDTGRIPMEHAITKQQTLQAKRIDKMKNDSLIKDATRADKRVWRKIIKEKAENLHIKEVRATIKKNPLKSLIQKEIETKITKQIDSEAETNPKVKHWRKRRQTPAIGVRHEYMAKLNRIQCNVIMKVKASMIKVK